MTPAFIVGGLAAYGAAGLLTPLAFVAFRVTRVLPAPVAVTLGARILLIPALWPALAIMVALSRIAS